MLKQSKFFLCSAIFCLIFVKVDLVNSQTLDEELKECSEITVSLIRLQCYDRLAKAPQVTSAQPAAKPERRSLFQRRARDNRPERQEQQTVIQNGFGMEPMNEMNGMDAVSYTHLRAHETPEHRVCRLLL